MPHHVEWGGEGVERDGEAGGGEGDTGRGQRLVG